MAFVQHLLEIVPVLVPVAAALMAARRGVGRAARSGQANKPLKLGPYTLEEKIGEGGMGEVYRARHAMLRRPSAVKLMSGRSEEEIRRFENEVQLTAELKHPNTISIYDYGRAPDGTLYYAMELLDGLTLEELVRRHGPQSPQRVIHILLQVCAALSEAHHKGLIHRDIKPDNIFLCRQAASDDMVKVLDFGLVKKVTTDATPTRSNVNLIVGSPLYMSPEAIKTPHDVDARADLYALGAVAYFLLTGTPVFFGKGVVEVCGHHLHSIPERPSRRTAEAIPENLERLVLDCLAKDRRLRPESAEAIAQRLRDCLDSQQECVRSFTPCDLPTYERAA